MLGPPMHAPIVSAREVATPKDGKLRKLPKGFWRKHSNQRFYFHWLGMQLDVKHLDDWYQVDTETVMQREGFGLVNHVYGGSFCRTLQNVFPEHSWQPWRFAKTPKSFWNDPCNREDYFFWIAQELQIFTPTQWYSAELTERAGSTLIIAHYKGSISKALCDLFPEIPWEIWKFDTLPQNLSNKAQANYCHWLSKQLCIQTVDEWYQVAVEHVLHFKGRNFVCRGFTTLHEILQRFYSFPWKLNRFLEETHRTQRLLFRIVRELVPHAADILMNYQLPATFPSNIKMDVDVYIPAVKLAFEYQGTQHYNHSKLFGVPQMQQRRDDWKKEACHSLGISLIQVPYWWNYEKERITEWVRVCRPDVIGDSRQN